MFFKTDVFKIFAKLILVHRVIYSSSPSQIFFKMGFLKNFANFTGKHLCWSLFLIKLQAWRRIKIQKMEDWNNVSKSCGGKCYEDSNILQSNISNLSLRLAYYLFTNLLREKCPNTAFILVRIFLYSVRTQENTDQK